MQAMGVESSRVQIRLFHGKPPLTRFTDSILPRYNDYLHEYIINTIITPSIDESLILSID